MRIKMMVITESHETWPAKNGKSAGESFNLICQDMSQPASERMTDGVVYRLKDEEVQKFFGNKCLDKIMDFVLRRTAVTNGGKTVFQGQIMEESVKK